MKYILKYYTASKYLHFKRQYEKEFATIEELRLFLIENIDKIKVYSIYRLTNLSNK